MSGLPRLLSADLPVLAERGLGALPYPELGWASLRRHWAPCRFCSVLVPDPGTFQAGV